MASRLCCGAPKSHKGPDLVNAAGDGKQFDDFSDPYKCCTVPDDDHTKPVRDTKKIVSHHSKGRIPLPFNKSPFAKKSGSKSRKSLLLDVDPLDVSSSLPVASQSNDESSIEADSGPPVLPLLDMSTFSSERDSPDLGVWARFPSHLREERNLSAGTRDLVIVRDFASTSLKDSQLEKRESEPTTWSGKQAERVRQHVAKKKTTSNPLGRNLGIRMRDTGHRSSIAYGGKLEYPELELLPASKPFEFEPSKAWLGAAAGREMRNRSRQTSGGALLQGSHFFDGSLTTIAEESIRSKAGFFDISRSSRRKSELDKGILYDNSFLSPNLAALRASPTSTQRSRTGFDRSLDGSAEFPNDDAFGKSRSSLSPARKASGRSNQSSLRRRVVNEATFDTSLLFPPDAEEGYLKQKQSKRQHNRSGSGRSHISSKAVASSCGSASSQSQYSIRSLWNGRIASDEMQDPPQTLDSMADRWGRSLDSSEQALIEGALSTATEAWEY